jgi:alpha,alpha-trehalase
MPDGAVLNRYWDASDTPRDESYLEDVTTAKAVPSRPANDVYRDLRAGAESGWDYSSRWFGDGRTLATIRTTSIVPVDLNSLMFHLETTIVKGCTVARRRMRGRFFRAGRAPRRRDQPLSVEPPRLLRRLRLAVAQAARRRDGRCAVSAVCRRRVAGAREGDRARGTQDAVAAGRLATTTQNTGQQWDAPNGWAPLQWIAIEGLRRYGEPALAKDIGTRFLADVKHVYATEGKLVEKYVEGAGEGGGGGGEYPLQDGFGWTNGVTLKLLGLYGE